MAKSKLIALSAVVALGLAACENTASGGGRAGGSRVCTPFPEGTAQSGTNAPAAPISSDPAAALDDCLHRWAYSLAVSADPAEQVADASVAACAGNLARWNQQGLTAGAPGAPAANMTETAPSLLTGQPTNPIAEHYNFAQSRALFYVVQARAGKCPAPPNPPSPASRP